MPATDVRITEVMYNPVSQNDLSFEFLEFTNLGSETIDISDWAVGNADGMPEVFFDTSGGPILLGPGQTAILVPTGTKQTDVEVSFEGVYGILPEGTIYINASSAGPNDGTLGLSNSGETITLIAGPDGIADVVSYPNIANGSLTRELSVGITFDGNGDQIFTTQTPDPGVSAAIIPPATGPTEGDDTLVGTDGDDVISLLGGRDSYTGGLGDDSINGGEGNDRVDGGRDNDTIELDDGNDNAWGGQGNDTLFGGTGLDRLNGNSGDDSIFGGKGGDIIQGGKGEDYIEGGNQSDQINGGAQSDEIYGGTGDDEIRGGTGADLIYGGSGGDLIFGGSFDDLIFGGHGADTLNGGADDDVIYGGESDDKLNGNSGDDSLFGDTGNDRLNGGSGADFLDGGAQSDRLFGGDGTDVLIGGLSDDLLTGGADADTFVFADVVNHDEIRDFEVGLDLLDLTAYGADAATTALEGATQTADGTLIDLGGNGSILLSGVSLADLTIADFVPSLPIIPEPPEDPFIPEPLG